MQLVFSALAEPRVVRLVRLYHEDQMGALYDVTGWTTGGEPTPALGVAVEDSGQARAYLIYGGDAGLRVRRSKEANSPWELKDPSQWGESHMVLSEEADVIWNV